MRIIARKKLRDFWERHLDSRQSLQAWYADVKRADWECPADVKDIGSGNLTQRTLLGLSDRLELSRM